VVSCRSYSIRLGKTGEGDVALSSAGLGGGQPFRYWLGAKTQAWMNKPGSLKDPIRIPSGQVKERTPAKQEKKTNITNKSMFPILSSWLPCR